MVLQLIGLAFSLNAYIEYNVNDVPTRTYIAEDVALPFSNVIGNNTITLSNFYSFQPNGQSNINLDFTGINLDITPIHYEISLNYSINNGEASYSFNVPFVNCVIQHRLLVDDNNNPLHYIEFDYSIEYDIDNYLGFNLIPVNRIGLGFPRTSGSLLTTLYNDITYDVNYLSNNNYSFQQVFDVTNENILNYNQPTRLILQPPYNGFVYIPATTYVAINTNEQGGTYGQGYSDGYDVGNYNGYQNGYNQGYSEGIQINYEGGTITEIFTNIFQVGMLPVNMFLAILNFEVFGINVGGIITGLLTLAISIIILRLIMGKNSSGGGDS